MNIASNCKLDLVVELYDNKDTLVGRAKVVWNLELRSEGKKD